VRESNILVMHLLCAVVFCAVSSKAAELTQLQKKVTGLQGELENLRADLDRKKDRDDDAVVGVFSDSFGDGNSFVRPDPETCFTHSKQTCKSTFTYGGKDYSGCTTDGDTKPKRQWWCMIDTDPSNAHHSSVSANRGIQSGNLKLKGSGGLLTKDKALESLLKVAAASQKKQWGYCQDTCKVDARETETIESAYSCLCSDPARPHFVGTNPIFLGFLGGLTNCDAVFHVDKICSKPAANQDKARSACCTTSGSTRTVGEARRIRNNLMTTPQRLTPTSDDDATAFDDYDSGDDGEVGHAAVNPALFFKADSERVSTPSQPADKFVLVAAASSVVVASVVLFVVTVLRRKIAGGITTNEVCDTTMAMNEL